MAINESARLGDKPVMEARPGVTPVVGAGRRPAALPEQPVVVNDAEAVGIAICGEADMTSGFPYCVR